MTAQTLIDGQPTTTEQLITSFKTDKDLHAFSLQWFITLTVGWYLMFYCAKWFIPLPANKIKKPFDAMIVRHRLISALHGVIAVAISGNYMANHFDLTCGKQNTYYETFAIANTFGFLLADFIYMTVMGFLDFGNAMHHTLGFLSYTYAFYTQKDLGYLAFHLFPGEISNVQMNLRELLRKIGLRYSKAYFFNEFNYMGIYLLARMFWIPSIYYFIFTCPESGIVISILYPVHCLQSLYYCTQMIVLLQQRYAEMKKISKLGMTMSWFEGLSEAELEKVGIKHYSNFKA